jgi:hypothetical protein
VAKLPREKDKKNKGNDEKNGEERVKIDSEEELNPSNFQS